MGPIPLDDSVLCTLGFAGWRHVCGLLYGLCAPRLVFFRSTLLLSSTPPWFFFRKHVHQGPPPLSDVQAGARLRTLNQCGFHCGLLIVAFSPQVVLL